MGNLTDDMTRLRGEIDALRGARGALMQELKSGAMVLTSTVSAMQADFAAAHTAMAKQTLEKRETFVAAVIDEVNSLLGTFSGNRKNMARKGRDDRQTFLTDIKRQVMSIRKNMANDLMGVRVVWGGTGSEKYRPVQRKEEPEIVMPPREEVIEKREAMPEFKAEVPEVSPSEPLHEEEIKIMAAEAKPELSAVEIPKFEMPPPVFSAPEVPKEKEKEKSWLDEKPPKTGTKKGKRGKK